MSISYEKQMRENAAKERKGLITIEVINSGKKPGKFGTRMNIQGPVDEAEQKLVSDFLFELIQRRCAKAEPHQVTT